ncbi:hypothetical protein [Bacillus sp. Au-Bac7]|uniref:hypothetical protein n=1 Tax=Bacillus sp. Au-Bac7 TaxID=2906458 RepID=UPI001E36740C|nr:hypothetical protein [Bacillus sp. Au-Bac7]MCE4048000.1 hypothetical protein [Bacillus sp. Au-Bac7]
MKIKIFVSIFVFFLLILSFWRLNYTEEVEFLVYDNTWEELIGMENEMNIYMKIKAESFQSREYLRTRRVF